MITEANQPTLPLDDIRYARPLMAIRTVQGILDLSEDGVIELIEVESVLPAFNIAAPRSTRRELRILSRSVAQYKSRRHLAPAAYEEIPDTSELLPFILPRHEKEFFLGTELQRALNCCSNHVLHLVDRGALAQMPSTQYKAGRYGSPAISRDSFINFLIKRRVL